MMLIARYGRIIAGFALGGVSAFLTYHLGSFFQFDTNVVLRALRAAAFAFVVPGLIAGIVIGNLHALHSWAMAAINFAFWFGFGWLFATFISKFIKLRRAIAAVGAPSDGSSSLGSR
jgi:hypothetical protein